jgi:mannose-6-phosphate isomerase-like protein (cupin superfamily)
MTQSTNQFPSIKHLSTIPAIVAGDGCILREIFHPERDPVPIRYSLAHAYVEPGGRTHDHFLEQSEVYYVIAGTGTMYLNGEPIDVAAGSSYYIPPHCSQYLINTGPERFEFLCIVDPPWSAEGETVGAATQHPDADGGDPA